MAKKKQGDLLGLPDRNALRDLVALNLELPS
jgi:hypothetical protein